MSLPAARLVRLGSKRAMPATAPARPNGRSAPEADPLLHPRQVRALRAALVAHVDASVLRADRGDRPQARTYPCAPCLDAPGDLRPTGFHTPGASPGLHRGINSILQFHSGESPRVPSPKGFPSFKLAATGRPFSFLHHRRAGRNEALRVQAAGGGGHAREVAATAAGVTAASGSPAGALFRMGARSGALHFHRPGCPGCLILLLLP